jgi:DNA-binding Xre family transcriptional regulator
MLAKNKFSQKDLVAWLGVSQNEIYWIETRKKSININHLQKMAEFLNLEIGNFIKTTQMILGIKPNKRDDNIKS